jgi:hypothetical protein
MRKNILLLTLILGLASSGVLAACSEPEEETYDSNLDEVFTDEELDGEIEPPETDFENDTSTYEDTDEESDSPYTEEELEADSEAPSTDPDDYDSNGQYVPSDGPSDNAEDYDAEGNYSPIEDMTQDEIEAELESMLEDSLGQ